MAHTKNIGGGLEDDNRRPLPRLPTGLKGKATKKTASKKRKYLDAEIARAAVAAEATERAERGGAYSGLVIADHLAPDAQGRLKEIERLHGSASRTIMMAGRRLPIVDPQPQGESQQQPLPAEPQPV